MIDPSRDVSGPSFKVSVVIPCHDGERYLADTLRSVLEQDHTDLEIVVVDDGSSDRTPEVIRGFGSRVRGDRQPHRGAAAARNRGVELATGEAITFLDADDLWTGSALSRLVAALASDPLADMAVGRMEQFVSPELPDSERARFRFSPEPVAARMCGTVLVRRAAFDRVGGFAPHLASGEFVDWFARAEGFGLRSVAVPELVLRRRLHRTNHGVVRRDARQDYLRVVKAALDRRRAIGTGGGVP